MNEIKARCAVIGAANIDIGGFPLSQLSVRDSNPGRVVLSAGGVGRNIACNLARLNVETHLVAPLGGDVFARIVLADCTDTGVFTDMAFSFPGEASSAYLFIADSGGDMQLAVSDMDICERLTPEVLAPKIDALNAMDAVVLDANLPAATLKFLADNMDVPLIADAVSAAKASRLQAILPKLQAIKPNALEAEVLTGLPVSDPESACAAACRLVELGVNEAYVTLGAKGVCVADAGGVCFILAPGPCRTVNATGAGDAFTAALVWAKLLKVSNPRTAARAGLIAASLTVESEQTVSPDLSQAALLERLGEIDADRCDI